MIADLHAAVDREDKLHFGRIQLVNIAIVQLDSTRCERIGILIVNCLYNAARHALVGVGVGVRIVRPDCLGL